MGINRVIFLMASGIFIALQFPVQAQFVTLEGKDFKLDGEDFFPIVVNFSMQYVHYPGLPEPIDPDELFYSIDSSWGPSGAYDCPSEAGCRTELLAAFNKVLDMGFNTIRLVGSPAARYTHTLELGPDERRFTLEIREHPHTVTHRRYPAMEGPGYTDALSMRHFTLLRDILDVADEAGIKVILLNGESTKKDTLIGSMYMYTAFDQQAVDDYAYYLARLAEELADHPALLAYDLCNEPHYKRMELQEWTDLDPGADQVKWLKEDICAFTTQWYNAIKANDPNHMVTLGGLGRDELEVWDPAVLKLDFYSLHTYPDPGYLGQDGPMDFDAMLQRHRGELHWFGQVCPMPWVIGETGFSANLDPSLTWPWMHGTESQQAAFAQASLEYTRAAGGSGWSWWVFQDFKWYDPSDKPVRVRENYFGLLRLGDNNAPWYDKPVVAEVQSYTPAPMPQPPGNEPPNYHNPNNLPTIPWLTGTVEDQHGQPIKEVNARIWCVSERIEPEPDPPPEFPNELGTFHSAYTDAAGDFIFYREPQTMGYTPPVYENLVVVGVGTDRIHHGTWIATPIPNGATHVLEMHPFLFSGQLANKDIYSTTQEPEQHYHAWTDLTVQGVTVHTGPDPGASHIEMAARHSVRITGEFHAQAGSELRIRIMETFPECDVDAFKSLLVEPSATTPLALKEPPAGSPRLELRFLPVAANNAVRVFPNPFRDVVEVLMDGMEGPVMMEVLDGLGRVVHRQQAEDARTVFPLQHLAPGPYHLLVRQGQVIRSHTLIKQP